ncbi:unnamed protein product, partial [Hapterophycus canaliculatus]
PRTRRQSWLCRRYPFTDDTCPPLESVVDFCENAKAWLDANEDNVVSLHCKAGKARAGIMAACLMVRMGETAQEAVACYDANLGADIRRSGVDHRSGMNHRAWVFLYERLIREVWGLREIIGTVSGQNPSLRAPPRLATRIRDVSLQLQVSPRQSRWKQILHHPSCAVYQQTPGGKALVHRARMPSVSPKKKGLSASVFAASLPRSVVVEGTFQVVVSAATGLFGVGKNVLDVWCNTTFLGEDGGRELFTFTENDLPPGSLAKRLLAAKVSVVLTHAPPDAPSPDHRHIHAVDWERPESLEGVGRDTTAAKSAMTLIGPVEHSVTPDTDPEEISDESTYDKVVNGSGVGGGGTDSPSRGPWTTSEDDNDDEDDDGRFYFSSDDDSTRGTPARRNGSLHVSGGLEPIRVLSSTSPWRGSSGNFASSNGFATPISSKCPSPLRSCPRSAISSKRERLYERTESREESTQQQAQLPPPPPPPPPPGASSGAPRWASSKTFAAASARMHELPPTADTPQQRQQESRPRASNPLGELKRNSLALPSSRRDEVVAGAHGAGDVTGVAGGKKPGDPAEPGSTTANGSAGKVIEIDVTSRYSTTSSGFRRPSPAVKLLLDKVAARSFDDPQSSRHTSAFGSETDQSERGGDGGGGRDGAGLGSFADGDGESARLAANMLADWVDSEMGSSPAFPDLGAEHRVAIGKGGGDGDDFDGAMLIEGEGVASLQPLKERDCPPARGVVAGVDDVQGALESTDGAEEQPLPVRHARRHGSTGMSWGEDAKLALARKRLQWEKSRRGASEEGSQSLRLHAALVAKREAELLAIETDVKQAVRILEERIARRESAEAALKKWRRQLPPKAYNDVMSCLAGNKTFGRYGSG